MAVVVGIRGLVWISVVDVDNPDTRNLLDYLGFDCYTGICFLRWCFFRVEI